MAHSSRTQALTLYIGGLGVGAFMQTGEAGVLDLSLGVLWFTHELFSRI